MDLARLAIALDDAKERGLDVLEVTTTNCQRLELRERHVHFLRQSGICYKVVYSQLAARWRTFFHVDLCKHLAEFCELDFATLPFGIWPKESVQLVTENEVGYTGQRFTPTEFPAVWRNWGYLAEGGRNHLALTLRRSREVRNHSESHEWGYGGSGPAQTALAIMLECTDQDEAEACYQTFKWERIAHLPLNNWVMSLAEIWNWLDHWRARNDAKEKAQAASGI